MSGITSHPPTDPSSNVNNINTTSSTSSKKPTKKDTYTQDKVSGVVTPLLSSETVLAKEKENEEASQNRWLRVDINILLGQTTANWLIDKVKGVLTSCCRLSDEGEPRYLNDATVILERIIENGTWIEELKRASSYYGNSYDTDKALNKLIIEIGKLHPFLKSYITDRETCLKLNWNRDTVDDLLTSHQKVLYDIAERHYQLYLSHILPPRISSSYNAVVLLNTPNKQDFFLHMLTHFKKNHATISTNEFFDEMVKNSVSRNDLSQDFNFMLKLARIDPTYAEYADTSIRGKIVQALITPTRHDTQG